MSVSSSLDLPPALLVSGAVNSLVGTLTARTLMLAELSSLLSVDATGDLETYRRLVIEENVCGKRSHSTRQKTFRHLRELYALDGRVPLFRVWLPLWLQAGNERPLLSLLMAATREPLLRATSITLLNTLPGQSVSPQDFEAAIETMLPGNYRLSTRASLGRNAASAWLQSGHLLNKTAKRRAKACAGPATTAFALFLGYLSEVRGMALFETFWIRLLDCTPAQLDQFAFAASARGWIDYKRIGDVIEIGFSAWLPILNQEVERPATKIKEGRILLAS